MLQRLYIRNYVIIDELAIDFGRHLNVMTGETGAGKSIIAGALSLVLGDRADSSVLINKEGKCVVEATFRIKEQSLTKDLMQEEGLDFFEETIIRREISKSGRSRAFVNDTPVLLNVLNKITASLVDLHRQFDQYLFKTGGFEYEILDAVAGNQNLLSEYQTAFAQYQQLSHDYETALKEQSEWQKEADYKQFLFDELEKANFSENEVEEAEEELQKLSHAEQIKNHLQSVYFQLEEGEPGINDTLRTLEQELESIEKVFPQAEELRKRLESARLELKDVAEECNGQAGSLDLNPEQLQLLQERVDLGYKLMKKHGVQTTAELLVVFADLTTDLEKQNKAGSVLVDLEKKRDLALVEVRRLAKILSKGRSDKAPSFSKEVNGLLRLIGMPNATLKVEDTAKPTFNELGADKIDFLWDANKSGQFQSVRKAASGGELSRIMLSIKTLTAEAIDLPTLIFDEVDTGISGEAARQVGLLLQRLGAQHQIICITHQPQIAGKGDTHFFVYKTEKDGKVQTRVKQLTHEERVQSIANMIGGEKPSEAALKNAREMVG